MSVFALDRPVLAKIPAALNRITPGISARTVLPFTSSMISAIPPQSPGGSAGGMMHEYEAHGWVHQVRLFPPGSDVPDEATLLWPGWAILVTIDRPTKATLEEWERFGFDFNSYLARNR